MLGIVYALLAAASFGFNNASARRGVLTGTALQGLVVSLPLGMLIFVIGATLTHEWPALAEISFTGYGLLALAGFMHFALGRYFNIRSLAAIGSNLASPIQQFQLLLSLTLAIVFLGETLTPLKVLGILLIVAAPIYVLRMRRKDKETTSVQKVETKNGFNPRMAEGYFCASMAALGFGSSTVLIKAGLGETNLSFIGGFVAYSAAMITIALVLAIPARLSEVRTTNKESLKWFVYSGIGVGVSQMFRFLALGIAPVTIVQPLNSLSVIFRMIFGYFLNREHERFDRYVIIGIFLSFFGALSLALSSDVILANVDLPPWLAEIVGWTWP
ncbi:MAG: EamA family transporter [Rhodospirillaceae bacterium]